MVFIKNKERKKIGINWLEFLAFIVAMYLIITKLCQFALWVGFTLAKIKNGGI